MSAVVLQWPSFFRHRWCQGSRMAASLWWETVAHVLGWLPSFGIIGEGGEGREEGRRCTERGPFKPCEIVLSVVGMIIPLPPSLRLKNPSLSRSSPLLSLSLSFHAVDQTTILRWAGWDPMPLEHFDYKPAPTVEFLTACVPLWLHSQKHDCNPHTHTHTLQQEICC